MARSVCKSSSKDLYEAFIRVEIPTFSRYGGPRIPPTLNDCFQIPFRENNSRPYLKSVEIFDNYGKISA